MGTNDPTNAEDAGQESSGQSSLPTPDYPAPPSQPLPPYDAWPPQPGTAAPSTYPDAGSYPAYPVYPPYPAPPGYANPPSGYFPYGPPPWGAPGWPTAPIPQSKPTSGGKIAAWVIGGVLVAVLVFCGSCVALNGLLFVLPGSALESSTPTEAPTYFSTLVPGPGCGSAGWDAPSTQSSSDVQCSSTSLLMTQPVTAQYLTEVEWSGPNTYAGYSAWVTTGALSDSTCSGLGFQGDEASYTGYICASGLWRINSYDSSGTSSLLAEGTVSMTSSYTLETIVTTGRFTFFVNDTRVASVSFADGGAINSIVLDLFSYSEESGSGTFSNFIYSSE